MSSEPPAKRVKRQKQDPDEPPVRRVLTDEDLLVSRLLPFVDIETLLNGVRRVNSTLYKVSQQSLVQRLVQQHDEAEQPFQKKIRFVTTADYNYEMNDCEEHPLLTECFLGAHLATYTTRQELVDKAISQCQNHNSENYDSYGMEQQDGGEELVVLNESMVRQALEETGCVETEPEYGILVEFSLQAVQEQTEALTLVKTSLEGFKDYLQEMCEDDHWKSQFTALMRALWILVSMRQNSNKIQWIQTKNASHYPNCSCAVDFYEAQDSLQFAIPAQLAGKH